ncbi:MAG TPA: DRTGG domain-containing protein [Dissulfurispiraceae bacterium]|nr:DRTGG domain-containing protein [Dissulfurispiraceae bacterium]
MKTIFLSSNSDSVGKTMITIGLTLKLKELGFKVGYMKPLGRKPVRTDYGTHDEDALFINEVLELKEPLDIVSPFVVDCHSFDGGVSSTTTCACGRVLDAYPSFSNKDFLLISGGVDVFDGAAFDIGILKLLKDLDARAIIIDKWNGFATADTILGAARLYEGRCVGCVINKVPKNMVSHVRKSIKPFIEKNGVNVLGIIPVDKLLQALTVRELAETLDGTVVCCERNIDQYVHNYLIGAMDPESAHKYFRRVEDKVVITGAHNSEMQIAALEASAKCIVITGSVRISDRIIGQAISRGVPIISVSDDTFTAVQKIESSLGSLTIRAKDKVARARDIVDRDFNIGTLLEAFA